MWKDCDRQQTAPASKEQEPLDHSQLCADSLGDAEHQATLETESSGHTLSQEWAVVQGLGINCTPVELRGPWLSPTLWLSPTPWQLPSSGMLASRELCLLECSYFKQSSYDVWEGLGHCLL